MSEYDIWGIKPNVAEKAVKNFSMSHGMFAGVPIICKDATCPYQSVCMIDQNDRVVGMRCPMEAAAIVERFNSWCRHFEIKIENGKIKDMDLADVSLIKDLVDLEVQILRAENRIALNGDFIGKTIVEIDNKGKVYRENTVTPEAEYKLTLLEKKYKVLQLLNATRKDKAKDLKVNNPSSKALDIFNKINEKLNNISIDDIDFSVTQDESIDNYEEVREDGDKI